MPAANRQTVDLSGFPDLVVIYLGMRVNRPRGLRTLAWIGPRIRRSVLERPDGLLLHEDLIFSVFPPHLGMRQYWRDFDAMERWARSLPHKQWWQRFVRDTGGTGFWHETTSCAAPWRPSTTTSTGRWASCGWRPCSRPEAGATRRGPAPAWEATPRACHQGDVRLAEPIGP
jgi:hypothetical protein